MGRDHIRGHCFNASAIKLFSSNNPHRRLSGVLLNKGLPVLGIVASLFLAANTGWTAAILGAALLAAGIAVYLIRG